MCDAVGDPDFIRGKGLGSFVLRPDVLSLLKQYAHYFSADTLGRSTGPPR